MRFITAKEIGIGVSSGMGTMPLSLAKASVNVGVVSGGTASNVVAGEASCLVDLRYESLDELNRIRDAIRALSDTVS